MWLSVTPWTVARQAPLSLGTLQARVLECVAMSSSKGYSQLRNQTQFSCIAGMFFTIWTTRETLIPGDWMQIGRGSCLGRMWKSQWGIISLLKLEGLSVGASIWLTPRVSLQDYLPFFVLSLPSQSSPPGHLGAGGSFLAPREASGAERASLVAKQGSDAWHLPGPWVCWVVPAEG